MSRKSWVSGLCRLPADHSHAAASICPSVRHKHCGGLTPLSVTRVHPEPVEVPREEISEHADYRVAA